MRRAIAGLVVLVTSACGGAGERAVVVIVDRTGAPAPSVAVVAAPAKPAFGVDRSTPVATARSFVQVIRAKRWDLLKSFIPETQRDGITEEKLEAAFGRADEVGSALDLRGLERALDQKTFVLEGEQTERATLLFGGRMMKLAREGGAWVVEDL